MGFDYGMFAGLAKLDAPVMPRPTAPPPCGMQLHRGSQSSVQRFYETCTASRHVRRVHRILNCLPCLFLERKCNFLKLYRLYL